ncbi:hypothetical protein [Prosthecomicrobium sp. N25]|uniref:hypothetical protein n=1 Tax=Prosthecomicrobium sp. N25 TaxID=3129254 RepID=UPI003076B625
MACAVPILAAAAMALFAGWVCRLPFRVLAAATLAVSGFELLAVEELACYSDLVSADAALFRLPLYSALLNAGMASFAYTAEAPDWTDDLPEGRDSVANW